MTPQTILEIATTGRGPVDITVRVDALVRGAKAHCGVVHLYAQHTSCSLLITENADPAVLSDLEMLAQRWAPDADPSYRHDEEGDDDMAAHARSAIVGSTSVSVPFCDGRMLLGTWQGIFLYEHRTQAHRRRVVVTLLGAVE